MKRISLRAGVALALVAASMTFGEGSGSAAPESSAAPSAPSAAAAATPAAASYPTCNVLWWKWEGTSFQYRRPMPNHSPTGWTCGLRQGDNNFAVVALQNMLVNCYNQKLKLDGDFGPATKQALLNAQTWHNALYGDNIAMDGIYGPESRDALQWPYYSIDSQGNVTDKWFCTDN